MTANAETLLRSALSELEDAAEAFGQLAAVFDAIAETRTDNMDLAAAGYRLAVHLQQDFSYRLAQLADSAPQCGGIAPEDGGS